MGAQENWKSVWVFITHARKTISSEWFIVEWGKRNSDKWLLACSATFINGNAFIICFIMDWALTCDYSPSVQWEQFRDFWSWLELRWWFFHFPQLSAWADDKDASVILLRTWRSLCKITKAITECIKILIITKHNKKKTVSAMLPTLNWMNYTTSCHCFILRSQKMFYYLLSRSCQGKMMRRRILGWISREEKG